MNDISVLEWRFLDAFSVDEGPVRAAQVANEEAVARLGDGGMLLRDLLRADREMCRAGPPDDERILGDRYGFGRAPRLGIVLQLGYHGLGVPELIHLSLRSVK